MNYLNKIMIKNITIGILVIIILFLSVNLFSIQNNISKINDTTIWELVTAQIENNKLTFISRVDTGAETTSIHAEDIKIDNKSSKPEENIWKDIKFSLINNAWEKLTLTKKIIDVRTVKNAEKKEERYYVYMQIEVSWIKKNILVNLNDREDMTYKLLLWRNFLLNDFLIKID